MQVEGTATVQQEDDEDNADGHRSYDTELCCKSKTLIVFLQ